MLRECSSNGLIDHCSKSGCGFKCCSFGSGGHIVILPHELDEVENAHHLRVIDGNYMGGKKVKCEAKDCKTCDNGYKPIMCRSYPLWVRSVNLGVVLRSRKCPLQPSPLSKHREYVLDMFSEFRQNSFSQLDVFLRNAWVDNYEVL